MNGMPAAANCSECSIIPARPSGDTIPIVILGASRAQEDDIVAQLMAEMSDTAIVGQLFVVTFPGSEVADGSLIAELIRDYRIGGVMLLTLYLFIFAYGFAIAFRSRNHFGRLLAVGLTTNLFLYVFINIAMVMGIIPVVGVPLPLISYGGTAMMAVMFGLGLMMSVSIHRDVRMPRRGPREDV